MKEQKSPLLFTLVVWVIWTAITVGGLVLQAGGGTPIEELVTSGLIYSVMAAAIFALAVIAYKRWWRETGVKGPDAPRLLRYLILPSLLLLVLLIGALTSGVATNIMLLVLVNTLFVGISEELANRGVLLYGLTTRLSIVWSVIISSIMFGGVHALNGFITGEFGPALVQAGLASLSGFWLAALRLRLTTIIPVIILHAIWDFSIFMISTGAAQGTGNPLFALGQFIFIPILVIYGIWMLRGYNRETRKQA